MQRQSLAPKMLVETLGCQQACAKAFRQSIFKWLTGTRSPIIWGVTARAKEKEREIELDVAAEHHMGNSMTVGPTVEMRACCTQRGREAVKNLEPLAARFCTKDGMRLR